MWFEHIPFHQPLFLFLILFCSISFFLMKEIGMKRKKKKETRKIIPHQNCWHNAYTLLKALNDRYYFWNEAIENIRIRNESLRKNAELNNRQKPQCIQTRKQYFFLFSFLPSHTQKKTVFSFSSSCFFFSI